MKQNMLTSLLLINLLLVTPANAAYQWPYPANASNYVGTNTMSVGVVAQQKSIYDQVTLFIIAFNRQTGKTFEIHVSNPKMNLASYWKNYMNDIPEVKRAGHSKDLKTIDLVVGGSGACFKYTAKLSGAVYVISQSGNGFGSRTPCKG